MTSRAHPFESTKLLTCITRAQQLCVDHGSADDVFDLLMQNLIELSGSEFGFIGRLRDDEQGRFLETIALSGITWPDESASPPSRGLAFRIPGAPGTLFERVIEAAELVMGTISPDDAVIERVPSGHPPLHSFAGVPLWSGGQFLGMAAIANRPGGYDKNLLDALQPLLVTVAQILDGFEDRRQRSRVEERLSAIVALAPDGILTIDEQGRVLDANAVAFDLLGTDIVHRPLKDLLGVRELPADSHPLSCATLSDAPRNLEVSVGEWVPADPSFSVVVVRDVTEQQGIWSELRESERRWQYALSGATDGVWDWDLVTNDVFFSPRWLSMLGYGPTELPHHLSTFLKLMHPEDGAAVDAKIKDHIAGRVDQYSAEFRVRHKDSTWRWILARGRILRFTDDGKPWRFMGTHVDITAQRRQAQQLRDAKELAESATRAKAAFLANMSHEIRTPMNIISTTAHLLQQTTLDEEQNELLGLVHNATQGLLGIVTDVLDLSKIESGHLQLEKIPFSLAQLSTNVVGGHRLAANGKGIELRCDLDEGLPEMVLGDPTRLQQILGNLLSNAIKFTDRGHVDLRIEPLNAEADGNQIRFSVTDTGIGIPEEVSQAIFLAFQQAEDSTTRRFGGTGLGLSICRHLVDGMGGHLRLSSKVDEGSCFSFELELGTATHAPTVAAPPPVGDQSGSILLVEDNPVNRKLTKRLLQKLAGCTIDTAVDGRHALEQVRSNSYDVILLDCQMPVMDGFETAKAIREFTGPTAKIPIIAQTANAFIENRDRCRAAGMDDFITKPIDPVQLLRVVRSWMGRQHQPSPKSDT